MLRDHARNTHKPSTILNLSYRPGSGAHPGIRLLQGEAGSDHQPDPAPAAFLDLHAGPPLFQTAAQQDQPRIEILGMGRQAQCRIDAELPQGKLRASGFRECTKKPLQDRTGNTFYQVVIVEEHALVEVEVSDIHDLRDRRRGHFPDDLLL